MKKKRTLAILILLLLIIVACVLLRATALSPSEVLTEETGSEVQIIDEESPEVESNNETKEETDAISPPTPVIPPVIVAPTPVAPKTCYVGGCSGQICSENPDVISTCEWRESYACYQTATCELQQTGECGWTETPALNSCLLETKSNATVTF